jgi:hypothetical protein
MSVLDDLYRQRTAPPGARPLNGEVVENPKDLTVTAADCLYFEVTGQQPEALYASFGGSITVVTPGCLYPLVHGSCLVFSPTARLKSWRVTAV